MYKTEKTEKMKKRFPDTFNLSAEKRRYQGTKIISEDGMRITNAFKISGERPVGTKGRYKSINIHQRTKTFPVCSPSSFLYKSINIHQRTKTEKVRSAFYTEYKSINIHQRTKTLPSAAAAMMLYKSINIHQRTKTTGDPSRRINPYKSINIHQRTKTHNGVGVSHVCISLSISIREPKLSFLGITNKGRISLSISIREPKPSTVSLS